MRLTILLYLKKLGGEKDTDLTWRTIPQKGTVLSIDDFPALSGSGSFDDFLAYYNEIVTAGITRKKKLKKTEIIGILPGNYVTYTFVSLPTKNRKKMIQAIPFLVEDFVIGELDEMHIGVGGFNAEGKVKVAIVEKKLVSGWIELLSSNNLSFLSIYGLSDIINLDKGEAKIIFFDNDVVFKGVDFCIQTSNENLRKAIPSFSLDGTGFINIFCDPSEKIPVQISRKIKIEVESDGICKVENRDFSGKILDGYDMFYDLSFVDAINLAEESHQGGTGVYYSFIAHALFAVTLIGCIQIVLNISSSLYFSQKTTATMNDAVTHYKKLFQDDPIVDIKRQWEGKLKSAISQAPDKSFSFLFSAVMSELLKQKSEKNSFKLNEFKFDADSGTIKINIEINSISTLDTLKAKLKERAIDMEISSANNDNNVIKALIVVKAS